MGLSVSLGITSVASSLAATGLSVTAAQGPVPFTLTVFAITCLALAVVVGFIWVIVDLLCCR